MLTIGLFGTCGNSKWRDAFIAKYDEQGIAFFNPQVDDWKEEYAIEEARHLAEDKIILFPVTNETYGTGSLSEVGFSILNAINLDNRRSFVILIHRDIVPEMDDAIARKESFRARALVSEHLRKMRLGNLYVVDTLEEMLEISLKLYRAAEIIEPLGVFNPHNKPR